MILARGGLVLALSALSLLAELGAPSRAAAQVSDSGKIAGHQSKVSKAATTHRADSAARHGPAPVWPVWPVADIPPALPGSILPDHRILAFYGNPISKKMGVLGELPRDEMLAKLDREVAAWNAADPSMPVQPALQMIAVVAQNTPGTAGKYRTRMDSALIERVYGWAHDHHALLILDVQVGQGTLQQELPRLTPFLSRPDVHLAIDPEFSMKHGEVPGTKIGTFDASDVNYASAFLQHLVTDDQLPPKVLVIHRFRRSMLTGYKHIALDPRVQIVIDMDGWGPPSLKRESYRAYVYQYPVEYTGFKLFYHNDTRHGDKLMSPADVLALFPKPVYIQYQ
jgi:hypothetical protein